MAHIPPDFLDGLQDMHQKWVGYNFWLLTIHTPNLCLHIYIQYIASIWIACIHNGWRVQSCHYDTPCHYLPFKKASVSCGMVHSKLKDCLYSKYDIRVHGWPSFQMNIVVGTFRSHRLYSYCTYTTLHVLNVYVCIFYILIYMAHICLRRNMFN